MNLTKPILALLVIALTLATYFYRRSSLPHSNSLSGTVAVSKVALQVKAGPTRAQPVSALPTAPARESPEQARERIFALVGLIPFQFKENLVLLGAKTAESQTQVNELFEQTFMMVIDSVVARGTVRTNQSGSITIQAALPLATQNEIRTRFYSHLANILGEENIRVILADTSGSSTTAQFDADFLGFGASPIALTVQRQSGGKTVMSIAAQSAPKGPYGSVGAYATTQTLDSRTFNETFPALAAMTVGSP